MRVPVEYIGLAAWPFVCTQLAFFNVDDSSRLSQHTGADPARQRGQRRPLDGCRVARAPAAAVAVWRSPTVPSQPLDVPTSTCRSSSSTPRFRLSSPPPAEAPTHPFSHHSQRSRDFAVSLKGVRHGGIEFGEHSIDKHILTTEASTWRLVSDIWNSCHRCAGLKRLLSSLNTCQV